LIILHSLHHINLIYLPLVSTPYKPPSFPTRRSSDLINSTPFYLRFAKPADLQWLVPVFWIGFNIAMFPASVIVKHRGGLIVMGAAGLMGALAVVAAETAGNLNMLIAAQFIAGAAWGCMLMAAVSAALAIGETGAEGKVVG